MKISVRLSEILGDKAAERGIVNAIHRATGIERHTVAALLRNKAKYLSLETLGRLASYLVEAQGADVRSLLGTLFGREPEQFWEMLAASRQLTFCLGARMSREWTGSEYVMSTDAQLQGKMLSQIARTEPADGPGPARGDGPAERRLLPNFRLLRAPGRKTTPQEPGDAWPDICREARDLYDEHRRISHAAVVTLGTSKVNVCTEILFARAFSCKPFLGDEPPHRARDRKCPVFFRWRDTDPQPPSCCGGLILADDTPAAMPGIYYETDDGRWEGVECDPQTGDAAFLFYAYRPHFAQADVACGGFSSRATRWMANDLDTIVSKLGKPQYASGSLKLGLYVIRFTCSPTDGRVDLARDNRKPQTEVIPVGRKAVARRLKGRLRRAR